MLEQRRKRKALIVINIIKVILYYFLPLIHCFEHTTIRSCKSEVGCSWLPWKRAHLEPGVYPYWGHYGFRCKNYTRIWSTWRYVTEKYNRSNRPEKRRIFHYSTVVWRVYVTLQMHPAAKCIWTRPNAFGVSPKPKCIWSPHRRTQMHSGDLDMYHFILGIQYLFGKFSNFSFLHR